MDQNKVELNVGILLVEFISNIILKIHKNLSMEFLGVAFFKMIDLKQVRKIKLIIFSIIQKRLFIPLQLNLMISNFLFTYVIGEKIDRNS